MPIKSHSALAALCYFVVTLSFANKTPLGANYWQCTSTDAENKTWTVQGNYQLTAINESYANCKKESVYPRTCKTAKTACEQFIHGHTTRPMWRCVALDRLAKTWTSNLYTNKEDAALAALAFCKDKSSQSSSCYIHLMTCRNLNAHNSVVSH